MALRFTYRERDQLARRGADVLYRHRQAYRRYRPRSSPRLDVAGSGAADFRQALRSALSGWRLLAARRLDERNLSERRRSAHARAAQAAERRSLYRRALHHRRRHGCRSKASPSAPRRRALPADRNAPIMPRSGKARAMRRRPSTGNNSRCREKRLDPSTRSFWIGRPAFRIRTPGPPDALRARLSGPG